MSYTIRIKLISIMLIAILLTSFFPKKTYALAPAVVAVSFIATAMVAAGAYGAVIYNQDTDTYSGSLWESASNAFNNMLDDKKIELTLALGTAEVLGYMALDKVQGLYDYLHDFFINNDTPVPVVETFDPMTFFQDGAYLSLTQYSTNIRWMALYTKSGTRKGDVRVYGYQPSEAYEYTLTSMESWNIHDDDKITSSQLSYVIDYLNSFFQVGGTYAYGQKIPIAEGATGKFPLSTTGLPSSTSSVNDGNPSRRLAIPLDPTLLNDWDGATSIPTTGPLPLPANPSDELIDTIEIPEQGWLERIYNGITTIPTVLTDIKDYLLNLPDLIKSKFTDNTQIVDSTGVIVDGLTTPMGIEIFKNTMAKLRDFDTTQSPAPKFNLDLNLIMNSVSRLTGITDPFEESEHTYIDFGYLDEVKFQGISLIEYFRTIIGFGFIMTTFNYGRRKIYGGQVIQ